MQIKRFEAKNMTTALRLIKNELGPDAVILSAKSLRKSKSFLGSMKYAGVEVTAAIDNHVIQRNHSEIVDSGISYLNRDNTRLKDRHQPPRQRAQRSLPGIIDPKTQSNQLTRRRALSSGRKKAISSLHHHILAQEVDRGIASEIIDKIKENPFPFWDLSKQNQNSKLKSILKEMGARIDRDSLIVEKPTVAVFVGNAGVGKTSTIAKLAALQSRRHKKNVGLITLDNYGITAVEQLKLYAQIIGIPLEAAVTSTELRKSINKFQDNDLILIDTPGINHHNQTLIRELGAYFAKLPNLQIHLVLSATTKEKDIVATIAAFRELNINRVLFTKLDETRTYGNLINTLITTHIPLSFICSGRSVPDDIEPGSIDKMVELLLESDGAPINRSSTVSLKVGSKAAEIKNIPKNESYFVANQNSDIYHCFDCKWTKKIKSENMIQFSSAKEADKNKFLPCSNCRPDRLQNEVYVGQSAKKLKLSGN